jgi:ATP-binding cassette subfamily B protein
LLITHNLFQAARADRILFLEAGRILECGTHIELMRAKGRYAVLYRLQAAMLGRTITKEIRGAYAA